MNEPERGTTTPARVLGTLERLCVEWGVEVDASALRAHFAQDSSLESVRGFLQRQRRDARIVAATEQNLARLALPTLLSRTGHELELLTRITGDELWFEGATGVRREPRASWGGGEALELSGALPVDGPFARRVVGSWLSLRRRWLTALPYLMLGALLGLAVPALTRHLLDHVLPDGAQGTLRLIVLVLLAVAVQRAVLGLLRDRAVRGAEAALSRTILRDTLARILATPLAQLAESNVGQTLQAMASAEQLLGALRGASTLLFDLVSMALGLVMIGLLVPSLALFASSVMFVLFIGGLAFGVRNQRLVQSAIAAGERARARLFELLAGISSYKAFRAEQTGVVRWLSEVLQERGVSLRRERNELWLAASFELGQQAILVAAVGWGGQAALGGSLSVGDVVAALMLLDELASAFRRCAAASVETLAALPQLARVDAATPIAQSLARRAPGSRAACAYAIELDDVWFRYGPEEPWVLRGYSLKVRSGEHLHLDGASGAGKSTLLRIIAGLYSPERGSVRVNGQDPAQTGDALLYLPQAAHPFEGSIEHNLRNVSGNSRQAVLEAAAGTGLVSWLSTLPMQLDTVLPPGGVTLSGGQRQWLMLTAAVASTRSVVLLDEPTSQVDRVTREGLDFSRLFAGKTLVYAAHEL